MSACEADINLISMNNRINIVKAYEALDESERGKDKLIELTETQKLKKACEHTFVGSEKDLSIREKKLAGLTRGVANELTLVFN